jgi:hypothetical protein
VLADRQHAVHGQRVGAEGERLGDGGADAEAVALRQVAAHVGLGHLVGDERHELQVGAGAVGVAAEEVAEDDVGVRPAAVLGDDRGDLLRGHGVAPGRGAAPGW